MAQAETRPPTRPRDGTAPTWRAELAQFEALLVRARRLRTANFSPDELRELGRLYRRTATRLARLRDRGTDPNAIRYLNALCVQAYAVLNVAPSRAKTPFWTRLPGALARTARAQILAWLLLLGGVYVGASLVHRDPLAAYALVPAGLGYDAARLDRLAQSGAARAEFFARQETSSEQLIAFGGYLFSHNTRVGLLAFAAGILAGIPTILLAVYNGLSLGALSRIFLQPPAQIEYLAWILPHGIPELTAISLCSAGGLVFGRAVAAPGRQTRRIALVEAGESAALLFCAALPFFLAAAVIESGVRESTWGNGPRFAVAGAMAIVVAGFYAATWVATRRRPESARWLFELPAPARVGSAGSPGLGSGPGPAPGPSRAGPDLSPGPSRGPTPTSGSVPGPGPGPAPTSGPEASSNQSPDSP